MGTSSTLRVGFVPGVTPDKWARSWRERQDGIRLDLVPVAQIDAEPAVRDGRIDMVLARLPADRTGLHLVVLYEEQPVVVVSREHPITAYDEIDLVDLTAEQFVLGPLAELPPTATQSAFPSMTTAEAVAVAACGTGIVVLPMSLARLHHRRDVMYRPVRGLPSTTIALLWRRDRDDEVTQAFVGVVRGRTPRSSRG